jgi:hypothetical protein
MTPKIIQFGKLDAFAVEDLGKGNIVRVTILDITYLDTIAPASLIWARRCPSVLSGLRTRSDRKSARRQMGSPRPLPPARQASLLALAIGRHSLTSVVLSPQPSQLSQTILACRFTDPQSRHRFARHWARRIKREVVVNDVNQMVLAPVAPLPYGRSEAIGRLVVNPGNGRAFDGRLRAAGLG